MQPPTTTHNHSQPPKTTCNSPQLGCSKSYPYPAMCQFHLTEICSRERLLVNKYFERGYTKVCNHTQSSTTIHNHPKIAPKSQNLSQIVMLLHFRC